MRLGGSDVDFGDIKKVLEQAALTTRTNSEQLGTILTKVKEHDIKIRDLGSNVSSLQEELSNIKQIQKENQYIEPGQVQELDELITNRVADLLHGYDFKKYFGKFKRKAWQDGKRHSQVVGKSGVYTKKMYFDTVKEYYGTWTPYGYGGVDGYISHLEAE